MDKFVNSVRAIIGMALLILVLIFCFQNMESAEISFLNMSKELPLFIVLMGLFAFAFFIGYLFGLISGSRKKAEKIKEEQPPKKTNETQWVKPTDPVDFTPNEADLDANKPSL